MKKLLLFICFLQWTQSFSQGLATLKWWSPAQNKYHVIEGQAWADEVKSPYDRLPARAEGKIADDVWNLSSHSAGLMIRFRSNAREIRVRYETMNKDNYAMDHMPASGASGIDLYAIDSDGKELWCNGIRSFSDTIYYRFQSLRPNDAYHEKGREYRLYLPLYNQVNSLEIGVDEENYFEPLPSRKEKAIVVYGTSIAQGACASRPGMSWAAILGRKMDRPVINLGFNGSGRLEPPVIDLLREIDAKIYILDCMPNLTTDYWKLLGIKNGEQLKKRVLDAVRKLRIKQPNTPILLADHAGFTEELISDSRKEAYYTANRLQREAFKQLNNEGIGELYYLTKEEIGLQLDDMVDGTHPSDLGMMHYAQSYEVKLREILKEPFSDLSTTQPCTQYREPHNYDWEDRHREILEINATNPPKTVFFGNSIIHFWGGEPRSKLVREEGSWIDWMTPAGISNYAFGWDRIENVLWRVYHGELDGFKAEQILLMIGTNNLQINTDHEIIEGLRLLIRAIRSRQTKAQITLIALLPRRGFEERIEELNSKVEGLAGDMTVKYADLGGPFLNKEKKIRENLFSDGLHPNKKGYLELSTALKYLTHNQFVPGSSPGGTTSK